MGAGAGCAVKNNHKETKDKNASVRVRGAPPRPVRAHRGAGRVRAGIRARVRAAYERIRARVRARTKAPPRKRRGAGERGGLGGGGQEGRGGLEHDVEDDALGAEVPLLPLGDPARHVHMTFRHHPSSLSTTPVPAPPQFPQSAPASLAAPVVCGAASARRGIRPRCTVPCIHGRLSRLTGCGLSRGSRRACFPTAALSFPTAA